MDTTGADFSDAYGHLRTHPDEGLDLWCEACIFSFWTALGGCIAWHKVQSRTGAWIGVELSAHSQDRYVEVVIPEKKVKELKEATVQLLAKTMVTVRA